MVNRADCSDSRWDASQPDPGQESWRGTVGILYTWPTPPHPCSNHCNQGQPTVRRVGGGREKGGTRGRVSTMGELPAVVLAALRNLFIHSGAWRLLAPHPSFERKTGVNCEDSHFAKKKMDAYSSPPKCLRL